MWKQMDNQIPEKPKEGIYGFLELKKAQNY